MTDSSYFKLVPLHDFCLPHESGVEVRLRASVWLKRLKNLLPFLGKSSFEVGHELGKISSGRLKSFMREEDWSSYTKQISNIWGQKKPGIFCIIDRPFSGGREIVRAWVREENLLEICPPSLEQILEGGDSWFAAWPDSPWVLDGLEKCFLRHPQGFQILRNLLGKIFRGELGPGLIVCNSWSWSFLSQMFPLPAHEALIFQAQSVESMAGWLQGLCKTSHTIRNGHTGEAVFRNETEENSGKDLQKLCLYTQGSARLAWHLFLDRLRSRPENSDAEENSSDQKTLWWMNSYPEISFSEQGGLLPAFLLNLILLHGGLSESFLLKALNFSEAEILGELIRMKSARILFQNEGKQWEVEPLAYLSVREYLGSRGFLVDRMSS